MQVRHCELALLVVLLAASAVRGATVNLPAAGDPYLREGGPNANAGSNLVLNIRTGPNRALVRFDQASIAGGGGPIEGCECVVTSL
jgi:hypothetical protein